MKMSKKFVFGIMSGLLVLSLAAADKILTNGDFSNVNQLNLPANWAAVHNESGDATFFVKKENDINYVELKNDSNKPVYLVQKGLELLPKKRYTVTYKVKSETESEYRVYIEWTDYSKKHGEPQRLKALVHNSSWQSAHKNWENKKFEFTCLDEQYSKPYFVLNTKGIGSVCFSNIDIAEATEKSEQVTSHSLISNGDFENGLPAGLTMNNANIVTEGNSKVLSLSGEKAKAVINLIKLEPGQRYKLSYMAKSGEKVLSSTGFQYFRVYVSWIGAEQKNGLDWIDTSPNSYQKKELIFTAPKINFPMTLTCELNDAGSLFIDNINIEQLPPEKVPDIKVTIKKPFFRNTIYSSDPVSEINGSIWLSEKAVGAEVKLISINSSKVLYQKKHPDIKGEFDFNIPAETLEYGKYLLQVVAFRKDGTELDKTETQIHKLQKSSNEVIYKNDMNCYINGKLFYPVMFWDLHGISVGMSSDELRTVFYHVTRNGVNLILLKSDGTTKETLKVLDIAKEFNAKIFLFIKKFPIDTNNMEDKVFTKWKHDTLNKLSPEVIGHEATFGYLLIDEPMWKGIPLKNIITAYDFVRKTDPYRPIWINEAPRGTVKDLGEYSNAADIWGVDIYPVPAPNSHSSLEDKGLTSVGKYTQIFCESVNYRKPILMALQGFSWHSFSKKPKIYPDIQQTKFMAFDCIVNGAQSISYWGMPYIDDPKFFSVMFDTTKRLSELSGVITLPNTPAGTVKADSPEIKFLTKENDGEIYIIAVNESDKDVDVKFSGKFKTPSVKVVFENREITFSEGGFSDKFKAYDVHIYASADIPASLTNLPAFNEELEKKVPVFIKHATQKTNESKYNGKAEWIWYPGKNTEALSSVAFRKDFEITEIPEKAEIIITADDNYALYINGTKVGEDYGLSEGGWESAEKYNITKLLKNGINTIYAESSDAGQPPCGFLAELTLKTKDGTKKQIITDSSWEVALIKEIKKEKSNEEFKGVNAEKITDYGKGPWGNNLTVTVKGE